VLLIILKIYFSKKKPQIQFGVAVLILVF